ncbi:MAG: DnaT-like ssDNA-binding domain-containing protein, partial [Pseudomonadota bacterium]
MTRISMSAGNLVPDPLLMFSAELAVTVGLEEAVLLQQIKGLYLHQPATQQDGLRWIHISRSYLQQLLPFWDASQLLKLCRNLEDLGLLALNQQGADPDGILLALREQTRSEDRSTVENLRAPSAKEGSVPTDAGGTGGRSTAQVQSNHATAAPDEPGPQLENHQSGTARKPRTGIEKSSRGQPLPWDFMPSEDMLELLERLNGIPRAFALEQLEDFTLYWRERGSAGYAWQNKFKQHVQFRWAKQQQDQTRLTHGGQRDTGGARRTRDRSLSQDLT